MEALTTGMTPMVRTMALVSVEYCCYVLLVDEIIKAKEIYKEMCVVQIVFGF